MAKDLYSLSLLDILPPSIKEDLQVKAMAEALDPELQGVSQDIREALILSRIDELPENVVDLLAWQFHVDFYELAKTLAMKRETVKGSILWHRKKGTVWAIKEALAMLGIKAEVTEWWRIPDAVPYTFHVEAEISAGFWSTYPNIDEATAAIRHAIFMSKAARSWLAFLKTVIRSEDELVLYHGIGHMHGGRKLSKGTGPRPAEGKIYHGVGHFIGGRRKSGGFPKQGIRQELYVGIGKLHGGRKYSKAAKEDHWHG